MAWEEQTGLKFISFLLFTCEVHEQVHVSICSLGMDVAEDRTCCKGDKPSPPSWLFLHLQELALRGTGGSFSPPGLPYAQGSVLGGHGRAAAG